LIHYLVKNNYPVLAAIGLLFAFMCTCLLIAKLSKYLPKDMGRDFAHDGKLSAGKPRGAGIIFILVFAASALLFAKLNVEIIIYLVLVIIEMLTGFFDDASKKPWGEYTKGIMDLLVAIVVAVTFVNYNSSTVVIAALGKQITMEPIIFCILAVILVWTSINVTNCSDGVDGLSGTLSCITLVTIYVILGVNGKGDDFSYLILLFLICILGYLWYNAAPSNLIMGDAGSRAIGIFISLAILKTGSPFLYLLVAFVLLVNGGIGLIKVFLLRFFKIHILKHTKTPLHDHVRKTLGWSNSQTVFRLAIIQIVVSVATVYMLIM
jgi:phospho-N-acetylmuramoyl-pentapeptide-transferase